MGQTFAVIEYTGPVITMSRLSKRLLDVVHHAQAGQGLGLVSEMSAPSWALYHGLKAVHVPHPIYLDGKWTGKELAGRFNPGAPEKVNGGENSIWNGITSWIISSIGSRTCSPPIPQKISSVTGWATSQMTATGAKR
jgi:hypothetical protein